VVVRQHSSLGSHRETDETEYSPWRFKRAGVLDDGREKEDGRRCGKEKNGARKKKKKRKFDHITC
jgi:hypothetical protein